MPRYRYLVGIGVLSLLAAGASVPTALAGQNEYPTAPTNEHTTAAADTASAVERARVDAVPTPKLDWQPCRDGAECATVTVPLDYDNLQGASTELAVLRLRARKPEQRIGSLFFNPGGPSVSATTTVAEANFDAVLLDRFDIVGFDPRGVGGSGKLRCFPSAADQSAAMAPLFNIAPADPQQEADVIEAARAEGAACAGHELAAAMSTAQAARDMDVLRRAVGDDTLTYLGLSYGTAIGQTYANMFPDRFRAVALDGVIDPLAWAGTPQTAGQPLGDRRGIAAAQSEALQEILRRCAQAGPQRCAFADGDPAQRFAAITERLRRGPLEVTDGDETRTLNLYEFASDLAGALYYSTAPDDVDTLLSTVWTAVQQNRPVVAASPIAEVATPPGTADLPYDSTIDIVSAVTCSDGRHPATVASWPAMAAEAERRTPVFGALAVWDSVPCAGDVWKAIDEDAYHGPFDRRTQAPVLLVGSRWDPATTYHEAVAANRLLPNSRLLTSTTWGHTATGTSVCATDAINAYLIDVTLPADGTVCEGDEQPFD